MNKELLQQRNQEILQTAFNKVAALIKDGIKNHPERKLHVICLSDDPASASYVKNKEKVCDEFGIGFEKHCPDNKDALQALLTALKENENNRIIVQWPFDESVWGTRQEVMDMVPKHLDVDGFHWSNLDTVCTKGLQDMIMNPTFSPTAKFVFVLLEAIRATMDNKDIRNLNGELVTVIGQGLTSGLPFATMAGKLGATVQWLNSRSRTRVKEQLIQSSNIIVSCAGIPNVLDTTIVLDDAIYINVGMSRDVDGKMKGDIDYDKVCSCDNTYFANPLFGSTGRGTCLCLALNTVL